MKNGNYISTSSAIDSLPSDVINAVLSQWISSSDLAHLDTALCNKNSRKVYLSIIGKLYFTVSCCPKFLSSDGPSDEAKKRISRYVQWLMLRQIQIRNLDLSIINELKHFQLQFGAFLNQVQELRVSFHDQSSERLALTVISNCASKIESLSFSSPISDHHFLKLHGLYFPKLRFLDLTGCKCSGRVVGEFFHRTPQLQQLIMDKAVSFDIFVVLGLKNCLNLQKLSIKQCSSLCVDALSHICPPRLSSLDLSHCTNISEESLMKNIVHLVSITRNLSLMNTNCVSESVLNCIAAMFIPPGCDKVIDIRNSPIKVSLSLRESLLSRKGLFFVGL